MGSMVNGCSKSLRIIAALISFTMIVLIANVLPNPILQLESYGLVISVIIGILTSFLAYMNRNNLSALIITLMLVGGITYHVVYLLTFEASLPEGIIEENSLIYESVSDYTLRVSYVFIVFLVLVVTLAISLSVKHPLELMSFCISLIALLVLVTSYAYISMPLLAASLGTITLIKAKSLKGLLVFTLVYTSILLPVSIAYHAVDYGLEKSDGEPIQGVICAMNYLYQSNYPIPLFAEIEKNEIISRESLTLTGVFKLITYLRFEGFKLRLNRFVNLTYHEVRSKLASSLIPFASSVLVNRGTTIVIALVSMYSGLIVGALLTTYVSAVKQDIVLKVLRKSRNTLVLMITAISLAILLIVLLWIGLILGVHFFDIMSSIGYYSPILMNYSMVLYNGLLLLITMYPFYIYHSLKTLHHIAEEFKAKYLKAIETLLNRIGVLRGTILRISDLAKSMQVYFKGVDEELSSIENEIASKLSWLKHAKSIEILQSNFNEYLNSILKRCSTLEAQLTEELRHILKLRQNMLINALELAKELNIPIDIPDHIIKLDINKASISELLETLLTLNKYMVNIVEVLIEKYKELGESIALLDKEGDKIQQDIERDVSAVKKNLDYDPYIAVELVLEKVTTLGEIYYDRLLDHWKKLREKLLNIMRESRKIIEKSLFIEYQHREIILEKIRSIEKYLSAEVENLGNLSSYVVKTRLSLLKLVNTNMNILENEISKAANIVQVDKSVILELLPIQPNRIMEINNRLKELSNKIETSILVKLAELMKQSLMFLDQVSIIRERCSSFWIAREIIDRSIKQNECVEVEKLPFRTEHSIWMLKLYAKMYKIHMEMIDDTIRLCPKKQKS